MKKIFLALICLMAVMVFAGAACAASDVDQISDNSTGIHDNQKDFTLNDVDEKICANQISQDNIDNNLRVYHITHVILFLNYLFFSFMI